MDFELPEMLTEEEEATFVPIFGKLRALTTKGLTGIDLIRCWIEWQIMPLSRREGLMCQYDGNLNNAQRFTNVMLDTEEINSPVKKLCGETKEACSKIGLKPFCRANPAPEVDNCTSHQIDLMPSCVP